MSGGKWQTSNRQYLSYIRLVLHHLLHRALHVSKLTFADRHSLRLLFLFAMFELSWLTIPPVTSAQKASGQQITEVDLPRIPPTEPEEALKTFELVRGFYLELVAAEPLVSDPVDACFDEWGRMYVAEMHGYPFSQEPTKLNPQGGGKRNAGIIRLLEDTNADGCLDRSTVFADGLSWPTSVCCYDGGIFVLAPKHLFYLKDTDGDDKADVRKIVLSGFGRDNVQALSNNLKWGLDNHIYFAAGRQRVNIEQDDAPSLTIGGSDLRFDPATNQFELVTGGQQFGHSMDDWGNRFVCSNSNHIQQILFPRRYLSRNPFLTISGPIRSIATDGPAARVFRASPPEPWRIIRQKWRAEAKGYRLISNDEGTWEFVPLDPSQPQGTIPTEYPVGFFTSASGVTIYRGKAYPTELHGNAFIGDVGGNLVHRKILKSQGVVFSAERADAGEEFLRSSDNWFRPVNFVNAPDGTLYILDMYRETIEHPASIPDEIRQFLDLYSGSDRGRIYRITGPSVSATSLTPIGKYKTAELIDQLASPNAWNRQTSQRLLVERQNPSIVPSLEQLASSSPSPLARLHALYILVGLDAIEPAHLVCRVNDSHPRVREHAIRIADGYLNLSSTLRKAVLNCWNDSDDRVRFQLALSLGEMEPEEALPGLLNLARDPRNAGDIQMAVLSSVSSTAGQLVTDLITDATFLSHEHALDLLTELGQIVGANPIGTESLALLEATVIAQPSPDIQQLVLTSLGKGLQRHDSSLVKLLRGANASAVLRQRLEQFFARAVDTAKDDNQSVMQRVMAINMLAYANVDLVTEHMPKLLSPQLPQAIQRATVTALAQQESLLPARYLIQRWSSFSPQIRRDVIAKLLSRVDQAGLLLSAIESKQLKQDALQLDEKQFLMQHANTDLQTRSLQLFGGETNTDRVQVVVEYQSVLELDGIATHGLNIFQKRCAICHQVGEVGHEVAPALTSVQNKSVSDLLIAILDPNREAQPNFITYHIITEQGRAFQGIIAAESATSITLRRAEAKEDVILRNAIEEMTSSGTSLMPEGFEKELSEQDLADVIAFIKSIAS